MAVSTSSSLIDLVTHDWKQINLPSLRSELDEKLLNIDQISNDNKSERKELSKQTKELKKCNKEEKLKKFGSVLKLYQKHIDNKDNECKIIFESFLKIYKILSEAPDPIDALQNGQIQILQLQSQLLDYNDIKDKLKNYEKEFNDLKNQEITVKNLKEEIKKIKMEQDKLINVELIKQENDLQIKFKKEFDENNIKYNECKLSLKNCQSQLIELQQKYDELQNNLLSQSLSNQQNDDIQQSTQNMLEEELDRANIKILTLTKERDELLLKQQTSSSSNNNNNNQQMIQFEIDTLKKRLSESKENCNKLQTEIDKLHKENEKLKHLNKTNTNKLQENIERLRGKLQKLPNEDEYILLKEKVTILQEQFLSNNRNSNNNDTNNNIITSFNDVLNEQNKDNDNITNLPIDVSMETLFNTKLQSLQSELTTLKLDLHSKNNQLITYKNDYDDIKQQYDEQKILIAKLENDLTKYINPNNKNTSITINDQDVNISNNDTSMDVNTDPLYKILNINNNEEEKKVKEDSMVTINIDKNEPKDEYAVMELPTTPITPITPTTDTTTTQPSKPKDIVDNTKEDNSAFLIVCEQRDRFRVKAQKLEQIKIRIESKLDRISADNAQLKQENVELYSKIKFLENYNNVKRNMNNNVNIKNNNRMINRLKNNASGKGDEIEMKYENLYEESMNPFAQFRRREKENRINSLDWTEWIAFMVGSTVLSKRLFRLFGVFYAIALHLLIFFTMMHEYRSHGILDTSHCQDQLPGVEIHVDQGQMDHVDHLLQGVGGT